MRLYRLGLVSQAVLLVSLGCLLSACPDSGGGGDFLPLVAHR